MQLYHRIRPLLFRLEPEVAHSLVIRALKMGLMPTTRQINSLVLRVNLAGMVLPNPVGLAAGFDKNAETLAHIFKQGFGWVECGTVTPKPQSGNPKPRVLRLPEQEAIINRLGFNNEGMVAFIGRLIERQAMPKRFQGIVGSNIGKNKDSLDPIADYVLGVKALYPYADYITINISSPNTQGLRDLQHDEQLHALLVSIEQTRQMMLIKGIESRPIFIKLAPDLDDAQKESIARLALEMKVGGLIISNTTITRPDVYGLEDHWMQSGGLSGKPLMPLATQTLKDFYRLTQGKIPLVGVGGIASAEDAYAKIRAGATAVQLYSALVYQGFGLVNQINIGLLQLLIRDGYANVSQAVGVDV